MGSWKSPEDLSPVNVECPGVHTTNYAQSWKPYLEWLCRMLRKRADVNGGKLVAVVLDQRGYLVNKKDLSHDDSRGGAFQKS